MKIRILFDSINILVVLLLHCFVVPAKATDMSTFISGIPTTGRWGEETYFRWDQNEGIANVMDTSTWEDTESTIQLSAKEWRIKKNNYGTIYGISACNANDGTYDEASQTYAISSDEQTDGGGGTCWCKITGVSGTDENLYEVANASWVATPYGGTSEESCKYYCRYNCAGNATYFPNLRNALLNGVTVSSTPQNSGGTTTDSIKIATTKYVEDKFAPSVTELNTAISTVKTVVDNTIIQADRIGKLYTGKQNRPDDSVSTEKCPFGRMCLLISDNNGTPHWWPICDANGNVDDVFDLEEFLTQLTGGGDGSYHHSNQTTYNELGGTGSVDTQQPSTNSIVRQLNDGEWALVWNNTGVVYGTSVCNDNNGTYGIASTAAIEQTETKGKYCWCRMSGVARLDGVEYNAGTTWVFDGDNVVAKTCAARCARGCATDTSSNSEFRTSILGLNSGN